MATLAMTPKLLGRISNEKYQEKNKWKIDDIALGPANELLISGHNLEISETFISMYKEYSGKYENFPEFNKNFYQTQPGKQLVLFLEGSSIIGLKVESTIRFINIEDMGVLKTLTWQHSPTCVYFYRGKLYAASSSSTIVSVFNLDSEDKSCIILSDMRSDCVLEFVVVMDKVYVCTKDAGRALVFSMTGSKKMEFKNAIQTDALARSICIHERTERVFISWSNFQIQLYSQKTSQCLYAFDMTEELHKILVTTENILVTLSASKCIVSVYDVAESELENLQHEEKQLEKEKDSLQHQQQQLRNEIKKEKQIAEINKQALKRLKKMEERNTKLEDEVTQLKERLLVEEKTTKEVQTSSLKLNKRIKDLEDMRTELESQQKKLKHILDQEKDKITRAERSRIQVVTNLKKVKEMNTKLEDEVTELKERLLVEEKTTKEVQTSFLIVVTNLKKVEERNTNLEDEVTELKERLLVEERTTKEMQTSSLIAENARKTLEQTKAMLEKEKEYLTKLLATEERNETEMKKSLAMATTTWEKLQKAYEILQKEKEDLSEQLSTEKINTEIQIASFPKMTSHALSGSEKTAQRKDEDSFLCDETQSVITESTDSGRGSMHSGLEYQDPFILNGRQLNAELKVAVTVASKGAYMHIPDTGVELDIPTGAAPGKVLIEMIILPFDKLDAPVSTFSCNSSVAVELLPNKMQFQKPVRLILPHCLKLTKNYKKTKNQVQVYVSHHETGPPIWEEVSNSKSVLDETNCVIYLKSFCWVKYEVNNKIVEAKRIRVYTAGKRLKHTEDTLAETEVGYHWDLPTARENLSVNDNMFVYQSKPFIYVKEGNLPLEIFLTKTVPKQWKYITPKENPKVISFKCVADSKEKSCPFVIEKSEPTDRMPFCMFKVQQGNEDLELYIRFDD